MIPEYHQARAIERALHRADSPERVDAILARSQSVLRDLDKEHDPELVAQSLRLRNTAVYVRRRLADGYGPLTAPTKSRPKRRRSN
jgi:hypothetical protein